MKTLVEFWMVLLFILLACDTQAATSCSVSATGLDFGNYDTLSAFNTDSTGTITVTCTAPWPVISIAIGPSGNSGVFNPRQMKRSGGTDLLKYNIFTDPSMSVIWGDGMSSGTQTVVHQPNKKTIPETVYGRITPGQDIYAGFYSDTLTVTITW